MRTTLAIVIGAVVAVLVIVFCVLPLREVSYEGIEKYQAPETYYVSEPYTTHSGATGQPEVTQYHDVAKVRYVWQERTVTLYKNVSFLEAAIAY
jgi:hypothetical protein